MILKSFLFWLPMILIAFINAGIREGILINFFSNALAHRISTGTLIMFCTLYVWSVYTKLEINSPAIAFKIGLIWMLLTITFEFAIGFFNNKSFYSMLSNYNIIQGNLWPLFLFSLLFMPLLIFSYKHYR